jgi:serralysin
MPIQTVPGAPGLPPGIDSLWQLPVTSDQFIIGEGPLPAEIVEDEESFEFIAPEPERAGPEIPGVAADVSDGLAALSPTAAAAPVSAEIVTAALPVENGIPSMPVADVGRSGLQYIDGLLSGKKWDGGRVYYSDPDSGSDYQVGYPAEKLQGFHRLSATQLAAVHEALEGFYTDKIGYRGYSVEGFTNLGVSYFDGGTGYTTLRFGNNTDANTAYAYYPGSQVTAGDVWFGGSGVNPAQGNYDYATVLHEIGHALGLKHGHEPGGYGALPFDTDSMEYSVMTYKSYVGPAQGYYTNEDWGYAQTFMMYDIAALQYLYGADFDFENNYGNTTYTWNTNTGASYINGVLAIAPGGNRIFQTIWDGNGEDTYDLSNYSTNLSINLNPGYHSVFSQAQLAYLGGGPNNGYARGNVFNALQYNGDPRSLIENATGGSGNDDIVGNAANNVLTGNGGDDDLTGFGGNDTLIGGAGNDWLDGHIGADIMRGGSGNDIYYIDVTGDTVTEDTADVSGGVDLVFSQVSRVLGTGLESLILNTGANVDGYGNDANNAIDGGEGINSLYGLAGNDTLRGNGGADVLDGGDGNDTLRGGSSSDLLIGGASNDVLSGGAVQSGIGADILIGGTGADRFDFDSVDDSPPGYCDIVRAGGGAVAFEGVGAAGGDRIDVSGIDANANAGGNQAFVFGGTGLGHLYLVNSGENTLVRCNTNSDATPEFELIIEDGGVLAAAYKALDFVL